MGLILCTAEKPSVAKEIASVIGAMARRNGYYEGNGYLVTWAVGHLVGLAEPEEYGYVQQKQMYDKDNPAFREKAYRELPLLPNEFKTTVLESTKEQFEIIRALIHRSDVDYIIDCGDMGPEGHILQWLIRKQAGCTKPVKRFCATTMTPDAIRKAMNNLRDANDYLPVIKGEFCKKKADWILGMSLSRCAAIKHNARIDIGRVLTPTLFFVVKRWMDASNFIPTHYYILESEFANGLILSWQRDKKGIHRGKLKVDDEGRVLDKAAAELLASHAKGVAPFSGKVTTFEQKERTENRPKLYDITELQRDGNRIFGYSASDVLDAAQGLYEKHKVLSYPRTDSRYITHDLEPFLQSFVREIGKQQGFQEPSSMLIDQGILVDSNVIDDSKVTDHHALLVTERIGELDFSTLSKIERNILKLVMIRILVALSEKHIFNETIIEIDCSGILFTASLKSHVQQTGVNHIQMQRCFEDYSSDEQNDVDLMGTDTVSLSVGDSVPIKDIRVMEKTTSAPMLHTEATLLTAMENAGSQLSNGKWLRGKGIGTQATRAAIIKGLFDKGYITHKGSTKNLIPTKQGVNVLRVLPADLYSPKITADWEEQIAAIVDGKLSEREFMTEFERFICEKVEQVKANNAVGVDFSIEKEEAGKCLLCGQPVYIGKGKEYNGNGEVEVCYCSNRECKFRVSADNFTFNTRTKRKMTHNQLKTLVGGGCVKAQCVNKNGAKYTGFFNLKKTDKGGTAVCFSFDKDDKRK